MTTNFQKPQPLINLENMVNVNLACNTNDKRENSISRGTQACDGTSGR